jgi:hypothetical protein
VYVLFREFKGTCLEERSGQLCGSGEEKRKSESNNKDESVCNEEMERGREAAAYPTCDEQQQRANKNIT